MSINRLDNNRENPVIYNLLINSIFQIIKQLNELKVYKESIEAFHIHIIPILKESFNIFPDNEQKAAERFILKIVYIYFFYRNYPPISSGPQFPKTELDHFLKGAAALILYKMEEQFPDILANSSDFQKLDNNLIQRIKIESLKFFED